MSHTERLRRSPPSLPPVDRDHAARLRQAAGDLTPRHEQAEARRKGRPGRKRRPGARRKHALPLSDRLLMLLMYYRT